MVVAVAVATLAASLAAMTRRHLSRFRGGLRAATARTAENEDQLPRRLARLRDRLNQAHGPAKRLSDQLDDMDRRVDGWIDALQDGRAAIEHMNDRRLVPVARVVRVLEAAARYAVLWRNPFG